MFFKNKIRLTSKIQDSKNGSTSCYCTIYQVWILDSKPCWQRTWMNLITNIKHLNTEFTPISCIYMKSLYQASENTGWYCFWLAEILTNTSLAVPLRSLVHEPSLTRIIIDFSQKNFSQSHICFGRQGEGGFR
jgi:hypothetical protein